MRLVGFRVIVILTVCFLALGTATAVVPGDETSVGGPLSAGSITSGPKRVAGEPAGRWIVDLVGVLKPDHLNVISRRLSMFSAIKGAQVAVLIVGTTAPATIDDYAHRIASKSGIGREGVNDGLLLLIAVDDRRVRIEVGAGLEGRITDDVAAAIISESISPNLRRGDFFGGISSGIDRLFDEISAVALPPTS